MGDFEETLLDGHATHSAVQKTRVGGSVVQVRTIGHSKPCPDPCSERPAPDVTTAIEYLHRDHLGSVEAVTDEDGDRLAVLAYDPYGERRSTDWTRVLNATEIETLADDLKLKVSRGHTGHEHLDRAGFVHMNGRIYDPRLGRFLSPDPVVSDPGSSQGWNSYSYVANSPMSFTDPSGLSQQPVNTCPPDICPWNGAAGGVGGGSSRVTQPVAAWQANVSAGFLVIPFPTFGYFGGEFFAGWGSLVIPFASADVGKTTRGVVVHDTSPADEPMWGAISDVLATTGEVVRDELSDPETAMGLFPGGDLYICASQGGCGLVAVAIATTDIVPQGKAVKAAKFGGRIIRRVSRGGTLRDRMGEPPPGMLKPQAHHDLPKKFRSRFEQAGLDIDDPAYGRWVEGGPIGDHQRRATEFNREWERFFDRYPTPTREQILDHMMDVRKRYH